MSGCLSARELSARGRGAIRVLELTGDDALARVQRLVPGRVLTRGEFAPVALRDERGALLDEALVWADGPARVELHLHGAPALLARVLAELGLEPRDEPPRSLEERAAELLARAPSEAAARVLLDQVEGALRRELEELRQKRGDDLVLRARTLARRGRVAQRLVTPPRVVLAGGVNAGKSTLFNALVGRERVVVDPTPGTTRDAVRERVRLGAYAVDLFDTAGERSLAPGDSEGEVERAGQSLAAELRESADLVLWLVPPAQAAPRELARRTGVVYTHADIEPESGARRPSLSALRAPEAARATVEALFHEALGLPQDPWRAGEGVPFEDEWCEALERDDPEALVERVARWLAIDPRAPIA
jgi:tRNA modification GTPase